MRLADVKWGDSENHTYNKYCRVKLGNIKFTVGHDPVKDRYWWYGYDPGGVPAGPVNYVSLLELACWLIDKELAQ